MNVYLRFVGMGLLVWLTFSMYSVYSVVGATTIMLNYTPNGTIHDARWYDANSDLGTVHMWNISIVPEGVFIDEVMACYNAFEYFSCTDTCNIDNDLNLSRVDSHSWNGTTDTTDFANIGLTNIETETWNSTFYCADGGAGCDPNQWSCFSVKDQMQVDYDAGWKNFSYKFDDPDSPVSVTGVTVNHVQEDAFGHYDAGTKGPFVKLTASDVGGGGNTEETPQLTITYTIQSETIDVDYDTLIISDDNHIINATFKLSYFANDIKAQFKYNDTLYWNTSSSMNATHLSVWRTFTAPLISNSSYNIQFLVNYSHTGASGNTSNYTQTIVRPGIADCGATSIEAKRIVLRNETTFEVTNGTIEGYIIWSIAGVETFYNFTIQNSTHRICITPNFSSVRIDAQFHYFNTSDTEARDYYLDYELFDNISEDIDLYQIEQSIGEQMRLVVKDQYGDPYPNVLVQVRRWYPGIGSYKTVASLLSDDSGKTSTYIRLNDVEHAFILSQDGVVLQTISKRIITTAEVADYIDLVISPSAVMDYLKYGNKITGYCSYASSTEYLSCSYSDLSGYVSSVDLDVFYRGAIVKSQVCDLTNSTIPSGSFKCFLGNATEKYFTYTMMANLSTSALDEYVILSEILETDAEVSILFGDCSDPSNLGQCQEGLFMTMMITTAAALAAVYSPIMGMVMMLMAVVVSVTLGLFAISLTSVIGLVFVAMVIIFKMRGSG